MTNEQLDRYWEKKALDEANGDNLEEDTNELIQLQPEEIQAMEEKQGNFVKVTGIKYRSFREDGDQGSDNGGDYPANDYENEEEDDEVDFLKLSKVHPES